MKPNLFFVLGAPKSGTTWLQHLLNAHPNVSCRGEGMFFKFAGGLQTLCNNHNAALAKRNEWWGEGFPELTEREAKELLRFFIVRRVIENPSPGKTNLQWIGERDPDHIPLKTMELLPKATFIHIIRDPRDRAVSMLYHAKVRDPDFNRDTLACAADWTNAVMQARVSAKQNNVRYHELRYEDLLDRPNDTATAVFKFLGVDTSHVPACINAASFEKLSGGRKPGQEDQAAFYRKGVKGDWRNHMDGELEARFVEATNGLMAQLGYT